ncbi:hypothetical protein EJ104_09130 [Deinococcus radiophilus]|uniref:Chorismate-utilising enzyme C-terminal domain-containing protein n=1 Tax=Deinococcus radiophilus TaxID=32062 RepID=A0A3S0IKD4_9DEIO|nr:chorismate-binding protein [Deinococcus radiophilus]RTR26005.1 hypothetical protein EJ104_09130 [Deinococcus radiophilus]
MCWTSCIPHPRSAECRAQGDGEWALGIRAAQIQGRQVRLWAGAGIVADSDPAAECAETRAKLGIMLAALGVRHPLEQGAVHA